MFELLDHFLDAGDGDVNVGHRGAHAAVALVLDQAQGTGFGDREVYTGHADLGGHEFLAQDSATDTDQFVDRVGVTGARHLVGEQAGDLLLGLVDRRHDDVRGLLAVELDDVLAHVALQRFDAGVGHGMVELDLLADHRFALDHQLRRVALRNADDDGAGLFGILGPMYLHTIGGQLALELFEQLGQTRQAVLADVLGE